MTDPAGAAARTTPSDALVTMEPLENLAGERARVGLYGGSFDPVHSAHLAVARRAAQAFELARVIFVPARRPPHKPDAQLAPDAHRLAMLELATTGDAGWSVDPCELSRVGPSYTIDTVRDLERRIAPAELWMILGSDNLPGLPHWRSAEELLALVRPIVVARAPEARAQLERATAQLPAALAQRLTAGWVGGDPIPGSATEVRARLRAGEDPGAQLPPGVAEYIRTHGLYLD